MNLNPSDPPSESKSPYRQPTDRSNRSIHRADYPQLPRHPLQVCASLVQNPANLGGLCRTAEAFRIEKLILSDLAITRNPLFRNLAVSTHLWQPLAACPIDRLPDWLTQQTQAGYTVIALDASSSAIPLPQFQFPPRSVLLLGQELTGIPAALLDYCQVGVTIPQGGLVDSLNVQTAGAIAIYAYLHQRS